MTSTSEPRRRDFFLRPLSLVALASALAACGGGGGGGSSTAPVVPQSIAGSVVDGYIAGATVSCLSAGSLVAVTTSDAAGAYVFNLGEGQACDTIESLGGIDVGTTPNDPSDDRVAPAGVLRSPVPTGSAALTSLVVSPVTTLVQAQVQGGATLDDAQAQVRTALGLSPSLDLLGTDPAGDAALYKATAVVAQLVEQIGDALAAAAGINGAAERQALAGSVFDALAVQLPTLNVAGLAPSPSTLTPTSPLFALVSQAADNAKANGVVGAALQGLDSTTFAAIASPLVASATSNVNAAGGVDDVVARVNRIDEQARSASVVGALSDLLGNATSEPQKVLGDVAAALAGAGTADKSFSVTVGGETASATMPSGLSNYALLRGDTVRLQAPSSTTDVPLASFEAAAGVSVPQELTSVGFGLDKSAANAQLSATPIEVPMAVQVTDATRAFQAIIDRVALSVDGSGQVQASVPVGAKLSVYGKSASAETTEPVVVTLAGNGLQIVTTTSGVISFSFDRLFEAIGPAASGGALAALAQNRVNSGTYDVAMVIGTLRVARAASASDSTPTLAGMNSVSLRAGGQSVAGHGFTGKVTVTP